MKPSERIHEIAQKNAGSDSYYDVTPLDIIEYLDEQEQSSHAAKGEQHGGGRARYAMSAACVCGRTWGWHAAAKPHGIPGECEAFALDASKSPAPDATTDETIRHAREAYEWLTGTHPCCGEVTPPGEQVRKAETALSLAFDGHAGPWASDRLCDRCDPEGAPRGGAESTDADGVRAVTTYTHYGPFKLDSAEWKSPVPDADGGEEHQPGLAGLESRWTADKYALGKAEARVADVTEQRDAVMLCARSWQERAEKAEARLAAWERWQPIVCELRQLGRTLADFATIGSNGPAVKEAAKKFYDLDTPTPGMPEDSAEARAREGRGR